MLTGVCVFVCLIILMFWVTAAKISIAILRKKFTLNLVLAKLRDYLLGKQYLSEQ